MLVPTALRGSRVAVAAVVAAAVAAAGCGSGSPSYCSQRTTVNNAIKGLPQTAVSGGVDGLQQDVAAIKKDANTLVASAKDDFPDETSSITSSVNALSSTVEALPQDPAAAQLVPVASGARDVVQSVKGFSDAAGSKCE
jgi:hypothetical protein